MPGILDDRGTRIHAVAGANCTTIVTLRRLLEFGLPLDAPAAPRWSPGAGRWRGELEDVLLGFEEALDEDDEAFDLAEELRDVAEQLGVLAERIAAVGNKVGRRAHVGAAKEDEPPTGEAR